MLRDIRDLTAEREAYAAELRRRWGSTGCLSVQKDSPGRASQTPTWNRSLSM